MGSLYFGGPTIQEVDGEMMMGLSIYGVAVMDGSLYSRFYGIYSSTVEPPIAGPPKSGQPPDSGQPRCPRMTSIHC